jgi:hypothetical protein
LIPPANRAIVSYMSQSTTLAQRMQAARDAADQAQVRLDQRRASPAAKPAPAPIAKPTPKAATSPTVKALAEILAVNDRAQAQATEIARRTARRITNPAKTEKKKGKGTAGNLDRRGRVEIPDPRRFTPEEEMVLSHQLAAMSVRPDAFAALRADMLEALGACIAGAKLVGPAGHGDRMTLFRLAGLPLSPGTGSGGGSKGDERRRMAAFGNTFLATAARMARHDPVTVDAEVVSERPSPLVQGGVTQKMGDLVRDPARADPTQAPADPPAEAAPPRAAPRLAL